MIAPFLKCVKMHSSTHKKLLISCHPHFLWKTDASNDASLSEGDIYPMRHGFRTNQLTIDAFREVKNTDERENQAPLVAARSFTRH